MSSRITHRSSLSLSRRWLDRLSTLAVTAGATLVLLAIASIFLFLIWASWPLFGSTDAPKISTQASEAPNDLVAALSLKKYLVRDANEQNIRLVSLNSQTAQLETRVQFSSDIHLVAADSGGGTVVATVSGSSTLRLYDSYDWQESENAGNVRLDPIAEQQLLEVPSAVQLRVFNDRAFHLLLAFEDRTEWLVLETSAGPLQADAALTVKSRLSLRPNLALEHMHWLAQGRLLLELDTDGGYRLYERDQLIDSDRLAVAGLLTQALVLKSSYSLAVLDETQSVRLFGLVYTERGPKLERLSDYQWQQAGVSQVFALPLGGLIGISPQRGFEWLDPDFNSHRTFTWSLLPVTRLPESWTLTPDGNLLGFNGEQRISVLLAPQNRRLGLSNLFLRRPYEGYAEPEYLWQSMTLEPTSEAKYSVTPLIIGTLKAAFYSLLFAAPLAIAAAIFTSYFLASELRARIKPLVELLAAIPTVILGLVAGLWLAPWLEHNLGLVALCFVTLPLCLLGASWIWRQLPGNRAEARLSGFELLFSAAALVFAFGLAYLLNATIWPSTSSTLVAEIAQSWGLAYEQRNAVVVGLAMGFAVIPTIYSISEDALAAVPSYLREGALAMGASEWQAARSVVLPMASPGILSAVMMGFARAIGETMIVLMATGNTATMDWSALTGLRTMAATLALEMPEVVPNSLHFQVLIFIALQLFLFTFVLNSIAEWIRSSLRNKVREL